MSWILVIGLVGLAAIAAAAGEGEGEDDGGETAVDRDDRSTGGNGGNGDAGTGDADAGERLTQADVSRIVQERLERERKKAAKTQSDLQAELDTLRAADEKRKRDGMDEVERLKLERQEALEARQAAEAEIKIARAEALRARMIAANAGDLPVAYQGVIVGDTEDAIETAITAAKKQFAADQTTWRTGLFRELAMASPEELQKAYGDDIMPLVQRLQGKPPSIGQPSNAGGQPPAPNVNKGVEDMTDAEFVADLAAQGVRVRF